MEMASIFGVISDHLRELEYQFKKNEKERDSFVGRMRSLLEQLKPGKHPSSSSTTRTYGSVLDEILECQHKWRFVTLFLDFIHKLSDAPMLSVPESVDVKVAAAMDLDEISKELETVIRLKYISRNPSRLQDLLDNFLSKIKILKAEFGKALEIFLSGVSDDSSSSFEQLKVLPSLWDSSAWTTFAHTVWQDLLYIKDHHNVNVDSFDQVRAFHLELRLLLIYLSLLRLETLPAGYEVVNRFFTHSASVILSTAVHSCSYWFNHATTTTDPTLAEHGFTVPVDLQNEIDLAKNPEFLELNLNGLNALNKSSLQPRDFDLLLLEYFPECLFPGRTGYKMEFLVMYLTPYFTNHKLGGYLSEEKEEDVQTSFAEILAVLAEVASLYKPLRKGRETHPPKLPPLLITKICLLRLDLLLKQQLCGGTFPELDEEHKIRELDKLFYFLRKYSEQLLQDKVKYREQILTLVQVVEEAKALYHAKEMTVGTVKNSLLLLLTQILLFKAESFFTDLLENASLMASQKDQIESLIEELKIVRVVANQLMKKREDIKLNLKQLEAAARRITFFSYSSLKVTEEMIEKIVTLSSDLSDKMKLLMAELRKVYSPFPESSFPKADGLGFMDFVLGNLTELLTCSPVSVEPAEHQIKEIHSHLKLLKSFLIKSSAWAIQDLELKDLHHRVIDVAYKVDYATESFEVDARWQHFLQFYDLIQEIRLLNVEEFETYKTKFDAIDHKATQSSIHMTTRASRPEHNEVVLDLADEEKTITNRLVRGSSHREVVSIFGMGGIGKTTLARKVYNSSKVTYYFHCRAWCTVSQEYDKREVLLEILSGIHGLTEEIRGMKLKI